MSVKWRGAGPDVLLELDRSASESLRSQLQRQLRDAIRANRLAHGERLPSSRSLAAQLGVSRGVIAESYAQLESEGYLEPRVGSGTHVARLWSETPGAVEQLNSDEQPAVARVEVDFEFGVPDVASFPMRDWLWALSAASRQLTTLDLGDEHGSGQAHLRGVVAAYLRRVRASSVISDRVVVCPGFRNGLNVVLRALCQIGIDTVALEDPGPVGHDSIAARSGLRSVAIGVDHDGIDIDALEASGAQGVVVTPAHQAPTGVLLTSDRRARLLEWARRVDGYLIEDDYDAEFRYDKQPVGSLQGLAPDRVIAMGSVSKTLSPMLRLGWIIPPSALMSAILTEKFLLGRGAPTLDQVALGVADRVGSLRPPCTARPAHLRSSAPDPRRRLGTTRSGDRRVRTRCRNPRGGASPCRLRAGGGCRLCRTLGARVWDEPVPERWRDGTGSTRDRLWGTASAGDRTRRRHTRQGCPQLLSVPSDRTVIGPDERSLRPYQVVDCQLSIATRSTAALPLRSCSPSGTRAG